MIFPTPAELRARLDPLRPKYHFCAPAQWMNDPNGPIFYRGIYHVFYQLNPSAEVWGDIHWGHARSLDLVHWTHLPIALAPAHTHLEAHCFSGCTVELPEKVLAFYTSIGPERPFADGSVQCVASSTDPSLLYWSQDAARPVLTEAAHGDLKVYEWRDPFVFPIKEQMFMILGGSLRPGRQGQGVVTLYRARDQDLSDWEFIKILYQHGDDTEVSNIECPNFFPLGNQWVLMFSPHDRPRYILGDFDTDQLIFHPKTQGLLDYGTCPHYYAPTSFLDPQGRRILFGWIGGFESQSHWAIAGGRGWNGCLAVPRELSLLPSGALGIEPVAEIARLRSQLLAQYNQLDLSAASAATIKLEGWHPNNTIELRTWIEIEYAPDDPESACSVALWVPEPFLIKFGPTSTTIGRTSSALPQAGRSPLVLRILLDASVLELFLGSHLAFTHLLDQALCPGLSAVVVSVQGGARARIHRFELWSLALTA